MKPIITPLPSESDKTTNAGQASGSSEHTMDSANPAAAPSAVEKIKEWERPRNGYKAMIDYDALYAEALDLAKRLDEAQLELDETFTAIEDWHCESEGCFCIESEEKNPLLEKTRKYRNNFHAYKTRAEAAEAALKRKDALLREARQYLDIIGKPTMIVTRCDAEALAKRIDAEIGVKS